MILTQWIIANLATLSAIIAPIITGTFGYILVRSRARHQSKLIEQRNYIERQKQLTDEQQKFFTEQNQFRQEIREELKRVKESLLVEQKRNLHLEDEIREWKQKYNDLLVENQNLQIQITEMKVKLSLLSKGSEFTEISEEYEKSEISEQGDEI